jgi:hypothetical protein
LLPSFSYYLLKADIVCGTACKCQNCENYTDSVLLKDLRLSKPRSRTTPTSKRPRVGTPGSVVGPSMLMAAAAAADKPIQDATISAMLAKSKHSSIDLAVPATPCSPASEVTSEWTPYSSHVNKEEGTKPFGKACPKLKQNVIFQVTIIRCGIYLFIVKIPLTIYCLFYYYRVLFF